MSDINMFTSKDIVYLLEKFAAILDDDTSYTKDDCVHFLRKMAEYIIDCEVKIGGIK